MARGNESQQARLLVSSASTHLCLHLIFICVFTRSLHISLTRWHILINTTSTEINDIIKSPNLQEMQCLMRRSCHVVQLVFITLTSLRLRKNPMHPPPDKAQGNYGMGLGELVKKY